MSAHASTTGFPPVVRSIGEVISAVADVTPQPRRLGWRRRLAWGMRLADAAAIAIAVYIAQIARFGETGVGPNVIGIDSVDVAYAVTSIALAVTWLVSL